MRYFLIEDMDPAESRIVIRGSDAGHIIHVLRLRPGDLIVLCNGRGMTWNARIESLTSDSVKARVLSERLSNAESHVDIIVGQSYLKDRKMDLLVRQLTELGISKWMPFYSARSVPRPDRRRIASRVQRWEKISREALKQCKRGKVMAIHPPIGFQDVLAKGRDCDLKIVFWENQDATVLIGNLTAKPAPIRKIFAILGPEGGFSTNEIDTAASHGFVRVGLGPRILRAETATVTAVSILQYLFGDLGKSS